MRRGVVVLALLALAGCGGGSGGGGSSPGVTAPTPVATNGNGNGNGGGTPQGEQGVPPAGAPNSPYPTLSTVNSSNGGVRVYTSIMSNDPSSDPTRGQVTGKADGAGNFTFTVRANADTPAYTFTVGMVNSTALHTLDGPSCGACWRSGSFATPAVFGTFTYLDPTMAGFSYLSIGTWAVRYGSPDGPMATGAGVIGIPTRTADIPKTGTASYAGQFIGAYRRSASTVFDIPVAAMANATANFSLGTIALQTSNTARQGGDNSNNMAWLDFAGTMSGMSNNQLRGTMITKSGLMGDANGAFFGPSAQELGGAVVFKATPGVPPNEAFHGAFGLKKQ
jgi:hypothetical protein